jgi:hypothetical protein
MNRKAWRDRTIAVFSSPKFHVAVFVSFILALSILFVNKFPYRPGWDFRNNLWAPAYLLIRGQSPYNVSSLYEMGSAVWMPTAIGIFWFLGYISLQQASNIWWIVCLISLIAIVWLSSGIRRPPKLAFALVLFLAFLFPPTISHFSLGQITIVICLIFVVLAVFERDLHPFLIAILIALTLSKPQLAIFALPGYLLAYYRENKFSRTLWLLIYTVIAIVLTCIPLFFFYPQWIADFIHNQLDNPAWAHPSSLFILQTTFNEIGRNLWWLLLIISMGVNLWLWARLPKMEAVSWSLALTTLITPYVWSWDFVLLIPLLTNYLFRKTPRYSSWLLYIGLITCWVVLAFMKLTGYTSDELYWWVPWYLVGLILVISSLSRTTTKARIHPLIKLRTSSSLVDIERSKEINLKS